MKHFFALILVFSVTLSLACCGGNSGLLGSGSAAPAPGNVSVIAADSSAIISWDMQPGVEYWVFAAPYNPLGENGVTPKNCISIIGCHTYLEVTSPMVVPGLVNGASFSFSINGRIDGGKGGPGSSPAVVTPRLAGGLDANGNSTWNIGSSLGTNNLYSVTYGGTFVTVGANGAMFFSVDGINWTPSPNPSPGVDLYAVAYNAGVYLAVGARGLMLASRDPSQGWTQQNSGTTNDLYAISNKGPNGYMVAGANGTVIFSPDFVTWTGGYNTGTTNALYGVTYSTNFSMYVAVGAAGTVITSPDGVTWQLPVFLPQYDLKGVTSAAGVILAVGDKGMLVTSTDGLNWTVQNPISSTRMNAVTYGHQYIAVDDQGGIFASTDGLNWQQVQFPAIHSPLYSIQPAQYIAGQYVGQYVYSAIGAGGANLLAK